MATQYANGKIVTNGLVLCLDATDKNSYPGSGTTWYDVSGGNRHYSLVNGVTWNSSGYFTFDGTNDYASGPASNTFNLAQEHTVEAIIMPINQQATTLFNWRDSGGGRQIMSHTPWSDGTVYYDVGGCCGGDTRSSYSSNIMNKNTYMTFRCRTSTTPYRQVFENTVEKVNSGGNTTATMTFGSPAAIIGDITEGPSTPWSGKLYAFRLYNRALTDDEIKQNYNAQKSRFNL